MVLKIAAGIELPVEAVTQTFAYLARRGAGKTYAAKVMAEEMLSAGYPIVVLDPLGVWWGLRSKYPVCILGGEHADAPLEASSGKVVADFVVSERMSVIIDVSGFGENDMRRFVGDFATQFYHANREAIHWFVDEADEFAPQQAAGGPMAKCLGAMQNIVRRGRSRGIGCTLITQRSAVLNKSVLTQTECLVAMQTTGPHDLKAIDDWIKYHGTPEEREAIMQSLTKLQQGEAWLYSPAWLKLLKKIKFRKLHSYDSSSTPKPGEQRKAPKDLADIDLGALKSKMAETIERAEAEDPKKLRAKIAELQKQLAAKPAAAIDQSAIDRAVSKAVAERDRQLQSAIKEREAIIGKLKGRMVKAAELLHVNGEAVPEAVPIAAVVAVPMALAPKASPQPKKTQPTSTVAGAPLTKAELAILTAFYWLRDEEATPAKVSFYSGYTQGAGSFNNALGRMRSTGLLQGWRITLEGCDFIADSVDEKPVGSELRERLRRKLTKAENALLDALLSIYPERATNETLAELSGYTAGAGSFNNALGRLRAIEAAVGYERDGGVRASDILVGS